MTNNFNKTQIMTKAWAIHKATVNANKGKVYNRETGKYERRVIRFADSLKQAWAIAKREAKAAIKRIADKAAYAAKTIAEKIAFVDTKIFQLKMIDRWGEKEFARNRKLNAERTMLTAQMI